MLFCLFFYPLLVEEKITNPPILYSENPVILSGNSLKGYNMPEAVETRTTGALYGVGAYSTEDPQILCLIRYESGGNPEAWGDWNGTEYISHGILQFHYDTFLYYMDYYGLKLDYHSPQDQVLLAELMLGDNLGHHWTTFYLCP